MLSNRVYPGSFSDVNAQLAQQARLAPTGDTTDRTSEIAAMFSAYGCCRLAKGSYYVKNLTMPADALLSGDGVGTYVRLIDSADATDAIICAGRNTVENFTLLGGLSAKPSGITQSDSFCFANATAEWTNGIYGTGKAIQPNARGVSFNSMAPVTAGETLRLGGKLTTADQATLGGVTSLEIYLKFYDVNSAIISGVYSLNLVTELDTFRYKNITVPAGAVTCGVSLYVDSSHAITTTSLGSVSIKAYVGRLTSITSDATYDALVRYLRNGIHLEADSHPCKLSNIYVSGFSNCGIYGHESGHNPLRSALISSVTITYCGIGLHLGYLYEFASVSNVTANGCFIGLENDGGNNKFDACGFDGNTTGIKTINSENNGHGTYSACTINHNTDKAIDIASISSGMVFQGCHIFHTSTYHIAINSCAGILFNGCNFSSGIVFDGASNTAAILAFCLFAGAPTDNITMIKSGCYLKTGEAVT